MKLNFNESHLRWFNALMFPLAMFWTLSTIGERFLSNPPEEQSSSSFESFFEIFHFASKFGITETISGSTHSKTISKTTLVPDIHRVKAIYRSNSDSFVSISNGQKTLIVPLGGTYKEAFKLISLSETTATFRGYGKNYPLRLGHDDPLARKETLTQTISDTSDNISSTEETHSFSRLALAAEINDLQTIENSIDLSPLTENDKTTGFRVDSVSPDSLFAKLGLVSGDIILSVNNAKIQSYADALAIYTKIPHLHSIRISVMRNNLQKDLIHEITP